MQRQSLIEYLEQFRRLGKETAYVERRGYRRVRWTYRQVAETAAQVARELEARGVEPGDRVLLWGQNSAEWVAAFYGCLLRGAAAVPMDRIAAPDFVERVLEQVGAKMLVCSREMPPLAGAAPRMVLEDLVEAVGRHARMQYLAPAVGRADTAEIVFTSGTTAEPKGVVLTHGNILANLEPLEREIKKYLKYERLVHPIRFLNLLPLSHVFGQFLGLFIPPLLGGTVVFLETWNPTEILQTIRRERVSVLVTVPRLLETLKNKIERDVEAEGRLDTFREDFAAAAGQHFLKRMWRFRGIHRRFGWKFWAFLSGGAALDAETETFWERLAFAVIQGYGLTETTSIVSVNHPFRLGKRSIGKVLPGREVKLGENGEILVRGENVAAGYWQGRALRPVAGDEGWLRTGDLGELDAQGNLYFKGRKKNVIVTPEGMNVYPEDLEAALRAEPAVRDSVVVGLARNGNAEPCAVVILKEAGADVEAAVRRANERLSEYQRIRHWVVWPEQDFPRTPTQKPRLNVIEEFVQARLGAQPRAPSAEVSQLAELIGRITGRTPPKLASEARLETDLNLSSLDRVELLSALEDRYQIDLNETRFAAATTVGELEAMLQQPVARRTEYAYPRWAQRWPVRWIRLALYYLLTWPATLVLGWPAIRGRENLRGLRGPVLVIANHITMADIGYVLAGLPGRFRHRLAAAMEGERLWAMRHPPPELNWFRRWIDKLSYALVVALFNAFPLPQKSGFRESFAFAGELVDRGYNVLVFPEGARTRDGKMAPFRAGIGLLAKNLNLPVVPVRLDGLWELKQAGRHWARPGTVKVAIGAPVRFEPEADPEVITRELERKVAGLAGC